MKERSAVKVIHEHYDVHNLYKYFPHLYFSGEAVKMIRKNFEEYAWLIDIIWMGMMHFAEHPVVGYMVFRHEDQIRIVAETRDETLYKIALEVPGKEPVETVVLRICCIEGWPNRMTDRVVLTKEEALTYKNRKS